MKTGAICESSAGFVVFIASRNQVALVAPIRSRRGRPLPRHRADVLIGRYVIHAHKAVVTQSTRLTATTESLSPDEADSISNAVRQEQARRYQECAGERDAIFNRLAFQNKPGNDKKAS
jgi:hypothetical protein